MQITFMRPSSDIPPEIRDQVAASVHAHADSRYAETAYHIPVHTIALEHAISSTAEVMDAFANKYLLAMVFHVDSTATQRPKVRYRVAFVLQLDAPTPEMSTHLSYGPWRNGLWSSDMRDLLQFASRSGLP